MSYPHKKKYGGSGSGSGSGFLSSGFNSLLLGRYDFPSARFGPSFGNYGGSGSGSYFGSGSALYSSPYSSSKFGGSGFGLQTISEHSTLSPSSSSSSSSPGGRRLPRGYVPSSLYPSSTSSYTPTLSTYKKPAVWHTEDIDVVSPRTSSSTPASTATPGEIVRDRTFGTIKRGRTVIRISTKNQKENPYLSAEEQKERAEARAKEKERDNLLKKLREELAEQEKLPKPKLAGDKFREKFMIASKKKKYAGYRRPTLSDIRQQQDTLQKELAVRLQDTAPDDEKVEEIRSKLGQLDRKIARRYSRALKAESDDQESSEESSDRKIGLRKSSSRTTIKSRGGKSPEIFPEGPLLQRKATQKFFFPAEGASGLQPEVVEAEVLAASLPADDFEKNILAHRATTRRSSHTALKLIQPRKSSVSSEPEEFILEKVEEKVDKVKKSKTKKKSKTIKAPSVPPILDELLGSDGKKLVNGIVNLEEIVEKVGKVLQKDGTFAEIEEKVTENMDQVNLISKVIKKEKKVSKIDEKIAVNVERRENSVSEINKVEEKVAEIVSKEVNILEILKEEEKKENGNKSAETLVAKIMQKDASVAGALEKDDKCVAKAEPGKDKTDVQKVADCKENTDGQSKVPKLMENPTPNKEPTQTPTATTGAKKVLQKYGVNKLTPQGFANKIVETKGKVEKTQFSFEPKEIEVREKLEKEAEAKEAASKNEIVSKHEAEESKTSGACQNEAWQKKKVTPSIALKSELASHKDKKQDEVKKQLQEICEEMIKAKEIETLIKTEAISPKEKTQVEAIDGKMEAGKAFKNVSASTGESKPASPKPIKKKIECAKQSEVKTEATCEKKLEAKIIEEPKKITAKQNIAPVSKPKIEPGSQTSKSPPISPKDTKKFEAVSEIKLESKEPKKIEPFSPKEIKSAEVVKQTEANCEKKLEAETITKIEGKCQPNSPKENVQIPKSPPLSPTEKKELNASKEPISPKEPSSPKEKAQISKSPPTSPKEKKTTEAPSNQILKGKKQIEASLQKNEFKNKEETIKSVVAEPKAQNKFEPMPLSPSTESKESKQQISPKEEKVELGIEGKADAILPENIKNEIASASKGMKIETLKSTPPLSPKQNQHSPPKIIPEIETSVPIPLKETQSSPEISQLSPENKEDAPKASSPSPPKIKPKTSQPLTPKNKEAADKIPPNEMQSSPEIVAKNAQLSPEIKDTTKTSAPISPKVKPKVKQHSPPKNAGAEIEHVKQALEDPIQSSPKPSTSKYQESINKIYQDKITPPKPLFGYDKAKSEEILAKCQSKSETAIAKIAEPEASAKLPAKSKSDDIVIKANSQKSSKKKKLSKPKKNSSNEKVVKSESVEVEEEEVEKVEEEASELCSEMESKLSSGSSGSSGSTASSTLTAKSGSTSSSASGASSSGSGSGSSSGRRLQRKPRRMPSPDEEDEEEEEALISLDKICPAKNRPKYRRYEVDDFQFLKVLGKGSFGKVLLSELKESGSYFAIKCLKKDVVLEDDDVECTMIERKVLLMGSKHPYLCHLFCTFQTESHLFFVMEYLNGGDLMFHIQQSGKFSEERAKFYGAEIVSGLKFLHKKGVMYRDLKLDNILLDYEGHVRMADFGMCKLQIYLDRTADTFCGTPDYMSPEIIRGQKYNQCVDWWAFGVLLYEMLVGQSPFSGCDEDELFWSICNEQVHYPRFVGEYAKDMLQRLLEKESSRRLGMASCSYGDIKTQPFFRSIDWDKLERRELEPPYRPKLKHPLDVQYFDTAFTKEAARLTPVEKEILNSMDQTQFEGFSYTNPHTTD